MKLTVTVAGKSFDIDTAPPAADGRVAVALDGRQVEVGVEKDEDAYLVSGVGPDAVRVPLKATMAAALRTGGEATLEVDGQEITVALAGAEPAAASGGAAAPAPSGRVPGGVYPPMPGTIVTLAVDVGEEVEEGALLLVLEAMKMESEIEAPMAGKVVEVCCEEGQNVSKETLLVKLEQ